jgi:type IV pilus assembly protein PilM
MLFGSRGTIGLDIGSRYIKAVQLKQLKSGYRLEHLGITHLQPEWIVDGSILDSSRVVEALQSLVSDAEIKARDAAIGVSGHSAVITKRVALPRMSEDELSESIEFEAEQHIPFNIEEVNIDFQILGLREKEDLMDVLIVAVKKDKINEYVTVVKEAGLNPVVVDIDVFALENMYEINYEIKPDENVALVNVGASMININILSSGLSVFTRDSSVGSNLHTEALQKEFTISYNDAERLKQGETIEGISQEDVRIVLASASETIITEISRSFEYFRSTTNQWSINEIILSGGSALLKDFVSLLSEKLAIDVKVVNPFKNIQIPESFDKEYLKRVEPLLSVATGLALRRAGDR